MGPCVYQINEIKEEIYNKIENEVLTDHQKIELYKDFCI